MQDKTDISPGRAGIIVDFLTLRSNVSHLPEDVPFAVYTVGTEFQGPVTRLMGFSADQLMITFSGIGRFRILKQDKWDMIASSSALFIPAGVPHEYMPYGNEPWHVGYVTFTQKPDGPLNGWGFAGSPFYRLLGSLEKLHPLLTQIWSCSGAQYDPWSATETLFSFLLELKRQMRETPHPLPGTVAADRHAGRLPNSVVERAVQFMHDHQERALTIEQLSALFGYSAKQLTRLFRQSLDTTPLHYLQQLRLSTAMRLLYEQPGMTVRQIAANVGMEPVYFTRLFRRSFGVTPSEIKAQTLIDLRKADIL